MTDQPSRTRPTVSPSHRAGPVAQVTEFKDLVVSYARQETVDPLRALGRYLGFGVAGALLIGLGIAFGLLSLLRGLQQITVFNDPTEAEGGTFSWAPYLIVMGVGLVIAGLFVRTLMRMARNRR